MAKKERVSVPDLKDDTVRLNKFVAGSGVCSRRKADELIAAGEILVNGKPITEMGYQVLKTARVTYRGKVLNAEKPVYMVLNKPKDVITTTDDPQERKTVMELIARGTKERVYPVGRLDRNTTGVLLFTNDGDLALKLSHPSKEIRKLYHVILDKTLKAADMETIMKGVTLEDGLAKADEISYVEGASHKEVGLAIHSGKNRIVRRIFEFLGYEVVKLDRVMYAGLDKKDLKRGDCRHLTSKEVSGLMKLVRR